MECKNSGECLLQGRAKRSLHRSRYFPQTSQPFQTRVSSKGWTALILQSKFFPIRLVQRSVLNPASVWNAKYLQFYIFVCVVQCVRLHHLISILVQTSEKMPYFYSDHVLVIFSKWRRDFRPIRRIRRIEQNHPCINRIQLQPQASTENILVPLLPFATVVAERLCFHKRLSVHRRRCTLPWADTPQKAAAADGTHLTGMHFSLQEYIPPFAFRLSLIWLDIKGRITF